MKIADIRVRVFRYTSKQVRDSDAHTHPGDPHETRQVLLTRADQMDQEGLVHLSQRPGLGEISTLTTSTPTWFERT